MPTTTGLNYAKPQQFIDTFQLPWRGRRTQFHQVHLGAKELAATDQPKLNNHPSEHLDRKSYQYAYTIQDRKQRKALGRCRNCSQSAMPGRIRCTSCTEKNNEASRACRKRRKEQKTT